MQNQKKAGQAEDWELSEEYYRDCLLYTSDAADEL